MNSLTDNWRRQWCARRFFSQDHEESYYSRL